MGAAFGHKENVVYFYKNMISNKCSDFQTVCVENVDNIDWDRCKKLIVPALEAFSIRQTIWKMHHKVIIVECGIHQELNSKSIFAGIRKEWAQSLQRNFNKCINSEFDCKKCPIIMIFESIHQTRIKTFNKALSFYNLKALYFQKAQNFIQTKCKTKNIVCGMDELMKIFSIVAKKQYQFPTDLVIQVFCRRQNEKQLNQFRQRFQSYNLTIKFQDNFLKILENIICKNHQSKTCAKIQQLIFHIDEKQKKDISSSLKRLEKMLRHIQVKKFSSNRKLILEIHEKLFSTVVMEKSINKAIEICHLFEEYGIQDKVSLIQRESDLNEEFISKLATMTGKGSYNGLRKGLKDVIVIGEKRYAFWILKKLQIVDIKIWINDKQMNKIKALRKRKNQIFLISAQCFKMLKQQHILENFQSLVIIFDEKNQILNIKEIQQNTGKQHFCCWDQQTFLQYFNEDNLPLVINFNYYNKKIALIGNYLNQIMLRIKSKELMINNEDEQNIFFVPDKINAIQLFTTLNSTFSVRYLACYYVPDCLLRIKQHIIREIQMINDMLQVQENVFDNLIHNDEMCPYKYSDNLIKLFVNNKNFFESVNKIWTSFSYQNKIEHSHFTPYLFFMLFLGFCRINKLESTLLQIKRLKIKLDFQKKIFLADRFFNKKNNSYIYSNSFMICQPGEPVDETEISVEIDNELLTATRIYNNFIELQNGCYLIPPLTKYRICNEQEIVELKIHQKPKQRYFEMFFMTFIQNNQPIKGQLFPLEKPYNSLVKFFKSMENKKYLTAEKCIRKEYRKNENQKKKLIYQSYYALALLKQGLYSKALQKLSQDNPYTKSFQSYITRINGQFKAITGKKRYTNIFRTVEKKKWIVSYTEAYEKFYLIDEQKREEHCYTDMDIEISTSEELSNQKQNKAKQFCLGTLLSYFKQDILQEDQEQQDTEQLEQSMKQKQSQQPIVVQTLATNMDKSENNIHSRVQFDDIFEQNDSQRPLKQNVSITNKSQMSKSKSRKPILNITKKRIDAKVESKAAFTTLTFADPNQSENFSQSKNQDACDQITSLSKLMQNQQCQNSIHQKNRTKKSIKSINFSKNFS